jgi:hypothetical protein
MELVSYYGIHRLEKPMQEEARVWQKYVKHRGRIKMIKFGSNI